MPLRLLILLSTFNFQLSTFAQQVPLSEVEGYFQQDVKYTIHVSLNDKKHELTADEELIYKNNSPDTLNELYFHLWPNAYKNVNTLLAQQFFKQGDNRMIAADDKDFGYIDKLNF